MTTPGVEKPWASCAKCGQMGNKPPGLKLYDVGPEAIFVGDELALLAPQWLECRSCGHRVMVDGTAVTVIRRNP